MTEDAKPRRRFLQALAIVPASTLAVGAMATGCTNGPESAAARAAKPYEPTYFTKAEWARAIASALSLPAPLVAEVDWREAGQIAPRPTRVVLASVRHELRQPPPEAILRQLHI